jgi:hypoxanthine phosphoribosyltransferase
MSTLWPNLEDDVDHILIDQDQLQARIQQLAREIELDYQEVEDLLLICVLKGGYIFLSDLSRALKRPHELDFMGVSSYGARTNSSGAVQIIMDLKQPIAGRHVLIVEDIIDSGRTLDYLSQPRGSFACFFANLLFIEQAFAARS